MNAFLIVGLIAVAVLALATLNGASNAASSGDSQPAAPNSVVGAIANAIATAEGYFVSGSIPFSNNNPGDLTDSSIGGIDAVGTGTNGISIFGSVADGWNALYAKIQNILSGDSDTYSSDMSISELGATWADDAGEWASNVASSLGVSTDTTLGEYATANSDTSDGSD